jgi:hypothetical protein
VWGGGGGGGGGGAMCRLLECMLGELPSAGGTGVQGCGLENGGVLAIREKKMLTSSSAFVFVVLGGVVGGGGGGGGRPGVGFWNVCLESCQVPAALVCSGVDWRMVECCHSRNFFFC